MNVENINNKIIILYAFFYPERNQKKKQMYFKMF